MTQRDRVLEMLREGPKETGQFLHAHIPRFSARIAELRDAGYEITSEYLRSGAYRYELTPGVRCWVYTQWAPEGNRWSFESVDLSAWETREPEWMAA